MISLNSDDEENKDKFQESGLFEISGYDSSNSTSRLSFQYSRKISRIRSVLINSNFEGAYHNSNIVLLCHFNLC